MIIGSHNTMTYAKPRKWWYGFISPFAVCQNKTIEEQLNYGIGLFDLRVRWRKDRWVFAHGLYEVESEAPDKIIMKISDKAVPLGCDAYVRLILETSKADEEQEKRFVELCESLLDIPNIIYLGGNRKFDWKQIYDFGFNPNIWQPVSSMAEDARWYEKILPILYAVRRNKYNLWKAFFNKFSLFDFV